MGLPKSNDASKPDAGEAVKSVLTLIGLITVVRWGIRGIRQGVQALRSKPAEEAGE